MTLLGIYFDVIRDLIESTSASLRVSTASYVDLYFPVLEELVSILCGLSRIFVARSAGVTGERKIISRVISLVWTHIRGVIHMMKPVSDLSVLIVDDNRYFVSLLRTIVRSFGVKTIYEAPNAVAALETLNTTPIDMAFIDLAMPGIDGIELIGMVRAAKDSPNRTLPIIMLTADSRRNSIMKAIQAGADLYLSKPVRSIDVHSHMSHLLKNPRDYIQVPGVYFGPERRRSASSVYRGPERRKADMAQHFKTS